MGTPRRASCQHHQSPLKESTAPPRSLTRSAPNPTCWSIVVACMPSFARLRSMSKQLERSALLMSTPLPAGLPKSGIRHAVLLRLKPLQLVLLRNIGCADPFIQPTVHVPITSPSMQVRAAEARTAADHAEAANAALKHAQDIYNQAIAARDAEVKAAEQMANEARQAEANFAQSRQNEERAISERTGVEGSLGNTDATFHAHVGAGYGYRY